MSIRIRMNCTIRAEDLSQDNGQNDFPPDIFSGVMGKLGTHKGVSVARQLKADNPESIQSVV